MALRALLSDHPHLKPFFLHVIRKDNQTTQQISECLGEVRALRQIVQELQKKSDKPPSGGRVSAWQTGAQTAACAQLVYVLKVRAVSGVYSLMR